MVNFLGYKKKALLKKGYGFESRRWQRVFLTKSPINCTCSVISLWYSNIICVNLMFICSRLIQNYTTITAKKNNVLLLTVMLLKLQFLLSGNCFYSPHLACSILCSVSSEKTSYQSVSPALCTAYC